MSGDVQGELADAMPQGWLSVDDCRRIAHALLPVVERIARQAAAEALRDAALAGWGPTRTPEGDWLRARADAAAGGGS